ncbi:MAG TPA: GH92 family glycosyl hydrolase [Kofleriaceae bacterium]|nr:GH92 family glycosyl hydrolase [Kofleriaceae bacterium]
MRALRLLAGTVATLLAAACGGDDAAAPLPEVTDPIPLIDPTIGTGGLGYSYGSCFVGAAVPHGLVKVGPDTSGPLGTIAFQHYSGYWAGDDTIQGFSHLHLHGAGVADFGIVSVMPTRAFDPAHTGVVAYAAKFAKADEHAAAGRYQVALDGGIHVDLTATTHGAHHVYTVDGGGKLTLVVDLGKTLEGGTITDVQLHLDEATHTLRAHLHHSGGMTGHFGGHELWISARTRGTWTHAWTWTGGGAATEAIGDAADANGTGVGAALELDGGQPVELQLAVSMVSAAGADANLAAELPSWDVEATAAAAAEAWRSRTGVVEVTGGTEAERRTFYTSLYHAFLMPTVIADADGTYQLHGQAAPTTAADYRQMSDFSLWDTYRTVHPLYAWLAPDDARASTRSLATMAGALGGCPRWPIANGESGTMLGASCDVVVADAATKGLMDGADQAWPLLRDAALSPTTPPTGRGGRDAVEPYMQYGYVPSTIGRSVSHTTEYAHDDVALASLADVMGDPADADALRTRSHGWRMLFDPAVGFLRARHPDGTFPPAASFDPLQMSDDYAEANAWHSLWMAGIHDPDGLAELLGGRDAAVAKLQTFFGNARTDWETSDPSAASFPRPYYWHGNEPDLNAAFLFAQLGRPDLAQEWSRWIIDTIYSDQPDGVAGNDDGGTLGAWYVFASLGLYPIAGTDRYIVSAPIFDQARIAVPGAGHELLIVADGASSERRYVSAVTVDGVALDRPELHHAQLLSASRIEFTMTDAPTTWGQ